MMDGSQELDQILPLPKQKILAMFILLYASNNVWSRRPGQRSEGHT